MRNSNIVYSFAISNTFTYLMINQKYILNDDYEKTVLYVLYSNFNKKLEYKIKSYKLHNCII